MRLAYVLAGMTSACQSLDRCILRPRTATARASFVKYVASYMKEFLFEPLELDTSIGAPKPLVGGVG